MSTKWGLCLHIDCNEELIPQMKRVIIRLKRIRQNAGNVILMLSIFVAFFFHERPS